MYVSPNYKTKKAIKEAIAAGKHISVYQEGPFNTGDIDSGRVSLEGPHYPEPHRWYAQGVVEKGKLISIK